jgi:hypothetical protein
MNRRQPLSKDFSSVAGGSKCSLGLQPRHPHCQLIGMVELRWGEVTVRRFEGQRDEGQPEFCNIQDFFWRTTVSQSHPCTG